jgi:DNA-directed RNA polymerase subunit RPC12/RpoP
MGRAKKARRCPRCGSKDVILQDSFDEGIDLYVCADCDHDFEVGGSISKHRVNDFNFTDDLDTEVADEEWEN